MGFLKRKTVINLILFIQLSLLAILFIVYVVVTSFYFKKIETCILKRETAKFKKVTLFIIEKEKESLENILNSFALWEKFYFHCVKKDTSWLEQQLGNDVQVRRNFDIYGVFLEDGVPLYFKNGKLPPDIASEIIKHFKKVYKKGDLVTEFFFCFVRIDDRIYYIGASPLADDMGHLLSYGFVYFGKSVDRLLKVIRILTPDAKLSLRCAGFDDEVSSIPLRNASGRTIGCIVLPSPDYVEAELAKLGELEVILGLLILAYAVVVYLVLKRCQKKIMSELKLMLEVAHSINDFNPNLKILKELAEKEDEIGAIARSLLPIAKAIASRVIRDPLTGIFNREYFFARLQEELERMKRFKRSLSVAIFDIDDFKAVNDSYGHPAGDKVLKELCALIKKQLRSTDVFARIGGEEFGLLFPETDINGARRVCEKLRKAIEEAEFRVNGNVIKITASFGVTQAKDSDTVDSLYERADAALYLAKRGGKNRVAVL